MQEIAIIWRRVDTAGGSYWEWCRIWLTDNGSVPDEYQNEGWQLTRTVTAGDFT
jgi:hypothetical protein